MTWEPISTAPKNRYILITDGVCVPDIVWWHPKTPDRTDKYGTFYFGQPAGWFSITLSRSRVTPTHWMSLPKQPEEK